MKEIKRRGKIEVYQLPYAERKRLVDKVSSPLADEWVAEMTKKGFPANQILGDVYESFKKNI